MTMPFYVERVEDGWSVTNRSTKESISIWETRERARKEAERLSLSGGEPIFLPAPIPGLV